MLTATITTAVPLTAAQRQTVIQQLKKQYSDQELVLEEVISEDCIGGLKLTVGSREIDATVAGQLLQLKEKLLSHV